jgi:signal transduction histidine kinase
MYHKLTSKNETLIYQNETKQDFIDKIFGDNCELDNVMSSVEKCGLDSTMLLNLINDLLDLAKLEKMSFQLNKDFFDITETIN